MPAGPFSLSTDHMDGCASSERRSCRNSAHGRRASILSGSRCSDAVMLNADAMTPGEIHAELQAGYDEMLAGHVRDAGTAFADFRKAHQR